VWFAGRISLAVKTFVETLLSIENRSQSSSLLMKSNVTIKNALNVIPLENSVHFLAKSGFFEMDFKDRSASSFLLKPSVTNVYPQSVNTNTKLGMVGFPVFQECVCLQIK